MTDKKQELTKQEIDQVIKAVEEMVLDMNYEELMETATNYLEEEYLSKPRNYLIECGWIRKNEEVA